MKFSEVSNWRMCQVFSILDTFEEYSTIQTTISVILPKLHRFHTVETEQGLPASVRDLKREIGRVIQLQVQRFALARDSSSFGPLNFIHVLRHLQFA